MTGGPDTTLPPAPPAPAWRVRAALLAVQALFGVHYLAARWIVAELPPAAWAFLRVAAAAAILAPLALLGRRRWPDRRDASALALCALFGVVLNQALFIEGIARTTPAHAALINTQIPTFALAAAVALRQERLTGRKALSLLAGAAGVLALLGGGARFERDLLAGDLLNLANAASYGLFVAMSRRVMERVDPLAAAALLFLFGTLGMAAYGLDDALRTGLGGLSARAWGAMAFALLGATVITYFLNLWALARTHASRVAVYIFLQPIVAAGLGLWLAGDRLTARFGVAALLVLAALLLRGGPDTFSAAQRISSAAWSGRRGGRTGGRTPPEPGRAAPPPPPRART